MTPGRGQPDGDAKRSAQLERARATSQALGEVLLALQAGRSRIDDDSRARVGALRDELAEHVRVLDEGSVRKPFARLDAALRYGLVSGGLDRAVRIFLELEAALSSLAVSGRRATPLLPIAARRRAPGPPPLPAPAPPTRTEPGDPSARDAARSLTSRAVSPPPRPSATDTAVIAPSRNAAPTRDPLDRLRSAVRAAVASEPETSTPRGELEDELEGDDAIIDVDVELDLDDDSDELPAASDDPAPPARLAPLTGDTSGSTNRISFTDLGTAAEHGDAPRDPPAGIAALAATDSDHKRRRASSNPFAGFDAIDLAWMGSTELDALDAELARVTESSGLHDLDTAEDTAEDGAADTAPAPGHDTRDVDAAPTDSGLLPLSSGGFEDSGLFLVFVDDEAWHADDVEPPTLSDPALDEFSLEIDIAPPTRLSRAEQAFRGFVDHIDSILVRLCDSLELVLLSHQANELLDVHRQLNRLARVLDFVELDRQLSLIVFIQELLPVQFAELGGHFIEGRPRLEVDRARLPAFQGRVGELLNGLLYLLGYLIHEIPGLRRDRYERRLVELYGSLGILPAEPDVDMPTGPYGHADGLKLTSRTRAMLARNLEARLTELLEHIEGAMLHGRAQGYAEANRTAVAIAQGLLDHGIEKLPHLALEIADELEALGPMAQPDLRLVARLRDIVETLTPMLPTFDGRPCVERLQALLERASFSQRISTDRHAAIAKDAAAFDVSWPRFRSDAAPRLDALLGMAPDASVDSLPPVLETVRSLRALAASHDIELLERLFATLETYWERAPHACAHVLEDLAASIRALPAEGTRVAQLEALARSIVSDLVARRSSPGASRGLTDELGVGTLRLVTRIDGLVKQIQRVAGRRDVRELGALRTEARSMADAARRRDCMALALGCEVVAELASVKPEPGDETASLMTALQVADRCLVRGLDDVVERLDDADGDQHQAGVALWFDHWLQLDDDAEHDADTQPGEPPTGAPQSIRSLPVRRALHEASDEAVSRIEAVWQSRGSSSVFNAAQLAEYQQGLSALRHLVRYWGHRALDEQLAAHHVELVSVSGPDELGQFEARWEALRDALHEALPARVTPVLDATGQRFAGIALAWARGLQARLDGGEARAVNNWTGEARSVLEELRPIALDSRCVPLIGLCCELRNVLVASVEVGHETMPPGLEQLLYQVQRLVLALAPEQTLDEPTESRPRHTSPGSVRVPLTSMLALSRQAGELGEQVAELTALINAGPLTFTGRAGREALEAFRTTLDGLSGVLGELVPASVGARLEHVARRSEHRSRLLGRTVQVETVVDHGDAVARGAERRHDVLGTVLGAIETLAEGIVDSGFESGVEGTAAPTLRIELHVSRRALRATLDHNAAALDLRRARAALEAADVSRPPDSGVVGALGATPHALRQLRGGSALVLADAMLSRTGASLVLQEVGGWHRISIDWRDTEDR